jgi:tetratricopeptide (TPR) repeat protein
MDKIALFRKVVIGAAAATLDIAGQSLLPGAWPILRPALTPVLQRLSERFEGRDVTSSPELAKRAAKEFERDERLQELFRSSLVDTLKPIMKSQQKIEADVQVLCKIAIEGTTVLYEIKEQLDQGVHLTPEAEEKLIKGIVDGYERKQRVLEIARQQTALYPSTTSVWMSRDSIKKQIRRIQVGAVKLIREGQIEQARENLREAQALLGQALEETPTDVAIQILQGYIFKTMAQVLHAAHEDDRPDIERGEKIFKLLVEDLPANPTDAAAATNGLGNMYHLKGEYDKAILNYKHAVTILPDYTYAWHDMFLAYKQLAARGVLHLEEMRHAYQKLRETAVGVQAMGQKYLAQLEDDLHHWEQHP